jgi:hypothetical protein
MAGFQALMTGGIWAPADKIINVYLKTSVYLAGEGRKGLVSVIHPPIDTRLLKGLKKNFPHRPWKIKRIKSIQSYQDDYFPFIQECRSLAKEKGFLPIEANAIGDDHVTEDFDHASSQIRQGTLSAA